MASLLAPGDRLRDYEVIAPLPSGGMAKLFLARRSGVGGFSQQVALKLVRPELVADRGMLELFLDEARLAARVVHPNVVRVHEVGEERGNYFIAMEYVEGASLAEFLEGLRARRLRLRRKLCVWLATQVAEALHATHEAKGENGVPLDIVHRDVSPQNVLIGDSGHVKLIDFGVASSRSSENPLETGPFMLGKLRYAAPERLKLEPTDRRADVYALGVMLWEMLTARSFLRCRHVEDPYDWAIRENPPPPSKYAPHIPSLLDAVVLKAIHPDPALRYPSALRFRRALLRADPSAARVDAARIAALMELALGEELGRRQAAHVLQYNSFVEELAPESRPPPAADLARAARSSSRAPPALQSSILPPALPAPWLPAPSAQPGRGPSSWCPERKTLYSTLLGLVAGLVIAGVLLSLQSTPVAVAPRSEPIQMRRALSGASARPEPQAATQRHAVIPEHHEAGKRASAATLAHKAKPRPHQRGRPVAQRAQAKPRRVAQPRTAH
jgi:serine/threonine protein kinase